ncbi:hypothetical protein FACS1894137_00330 [Spirochaetia bacterium]|nr:hypothetical protein FACS1894137_00330 [Spirochaetia bacterium]
MSYNNYSYRILCEDKRQYYFIQSYLKCKGIAERKIRLFQNLPEGAGDAKQFVRTRYPDAQKTIAINSSTILVVARDADTDTYEDVLDEFAITGNRIFTVIPKRNIETWFYFIDNQNDADASDEGSNRKDCYPKNGTRPTKYGKELEKIINELRQNHSVSNMPVSLEKTIAALMEREKQK